MQLTKNMRSKAIEVGGGYLVQTSMRLTTKKHNTKWTRAVVLIRVGLSLGLVCFCGLITEGHGQQLRPFGQGKKFAGLSGRCRTLVATLLANPEPHIGKIYHLTGPQSENMHFYDDPYNDFISEGSNGRDCLEHLAEANNCVPHMLQVLNAARKTDLRIFYALHRRYRPGDYELGSISPIEKAAWTRLKTRTE
jgi:hypothetical protein